MARRIKVLDFGKEKNVEVSEEVYRAYKRPEWREERQRRVERARGDFSWDLFTDKDDIMQDDIDVLEEVMKNEALEKLHSLLSQLDDWERDLLLSDLTVRELAQKHGISKSTVNYTQHKLILLLEEQMKDFK